MACRVCWAVTIGSCLHCFAPSPGKSCAVHPWRSAAAVAAVMLGVALAFAVHVINTSALDEFSQAVRAVNGQPDLELRAMQGPLPEALYAQRQPPAGGACQPWLSCPP